MDRVTEDTRFLIQGLATLHLSEEVIAVILAILGNPENDGKMIDWLCTLDKEPTLERLLRVAEFIRKH